MAWDYITPSGEILHKQENLYTLYDGINNYTFINAGDNSVVLGLGYDGKPLVIHPIANIC